MVEHVLNLPSHFSSSDRDLINRAYVFAFAAHAAIKQVRKYTNAPYIVHPIAVARIVATTINCNAAMIAAALLHDVIEDTSITADNLRELFDQYVVSLVVELSNVTDLTHGHVLARCSLFSF